MQETQAEPPLWMSADSNRPAAARPAGRLQALGRHAWRDLRRSMVNDTWSTYFNHSVEVLEHNCGLARWMYDLPVPPEWASWRLPRWVREKLQRMGLPDFRAAYSCAANFLFHLLPQHRAAIAPLANVLTSNRSLSICIHFRAGDQYLQNRTRMEAELQRVIEASEVYMDCAAEVERVHLAPGQEPVW